MYVPPTASGEKAADDGCRTAPAVVAGSLEQAACALAAGAADEAIAPAAGAAGKAEPPPAPALASAGDGGAGGVGADSGNGSSLGMIAWAARYAAAKAWPHPLRAPLRVGVSSALWLLRVS